MLMTAMFTPGTTAPAWSITTPLRVAVAPWAYTLFENELIKVNESRRHTTSAINRADNEPAALIRRQTTHRHISLNLGMRVFSCEETLPGKEHQRQLLNLVHRHWPGTRTR